jgi:LPS sulfotransferase NodH
MEIRTSYVICSIQRSGTHFLGAALENTGIAGSPDEYLICDQDGNLQNESGHLAELFGQKSLEEFRELVFELGSTPNNVFGITIMWNYFHKILRSYRQLPQYQGLKDADLLDALLENPKYIWLTRRDKVRQAVSWAKASQTGVWRHPKGAGHTRRREPKFDFVLIDHFYRQILIGEEGWANFFESFGIKPLRIVYEDAVESYEKTVLTVLNYLEIPLPESLSLGQHKLQKQADELNEKWTDRYQEIKQDKLRQMRLHLLHRLRRCSSAFFGN